MPAFSPCGAIVGVLRSCYTAPCQWYPNGPVGQITYYFVNPSNKLLDGFNVFHPLSQVLQFSNTSETGERTGVNRGWQSNPNPNPANDGRHPCGTEADFSGEGTPPGGIPSGAITGLDLCKCDYPGIQWIAWGGLEMGGSADYAFTPATRSTTGIGLEFGGQADVCRPTAPGEAGGLHLGGEADVSEVTGPSVGGGVEIGGQADVCRPELPSAGIGLATGGQADVSEVTGPSVGGGVEIGGQADVCRPELPSAGIGLAIGGEADVSEVTGPSVGGGIELGGQADVCRPEEPGMSGGLMIGGEVELCLPRGPSTGIGLLIWGEADVSEVTGPSLSGGVEIGGSADLEIPTFPSLGGGVEIGGEADVSGGDGPSLGGGVEIGGEADVSGGDGPSLGGGVEIGGFADYGFVEGPTEPGVTCTDAVVLAPGDTFTANMPAFFGSHWYKLTGAGGTVKVWLTINSGATISGTAYSGSCEGLSPIPGGVTTVCISWSATPGGIIYIKLDASFFGVSNYTIHTGTGSCP